MKTPNIYKLSMLVVASVLIFASGCIDTHVIRGNNDVITEYRTISDFEKLEMASFFDVKIVKDSIFDLKVEAESNLMPYIITRVEGNTLILTTRRGYNLRTHAPIMITVHTPEVDGIYLTGSGEIWSNDTIETTSMELEITGSGNIAIGLDADFLDGTITGSGDLVLRGEVEEAEYGIIGSGDIRAYDMMHDDCFIKIDGSGSAYVTVNDLLDVIINGSGDVHYKGNPIVNSKIIGSGSVVHHQ